MLNRPRPATLILCATTALAAATAPPAHSAPTDLTTIAQIQGAGAASPKVGTTVTTRGVVTATYPTGGFNGFYLQTPGTGGNTDTTPGASDGIFVFGNTSVTAGGCYQVTGTVTEYNGLTELTRPSITPETGCAPVTPTPLSGLPSDDAGKEQYEGMLVQPTGRFTITSNYATNSFGQLGLAAGNDALRTATDVVAPGPAAAEYEKANAAKYITLDDGSSWDYLRNTQAKTSPLPYLSQQTPMRTGTPVRFSKPVILDQRFQWNFQPTGQVVGADDPDIPITAGNTRPTGPPNVGGNLQLMTFNVLNYFIDLGSTEDTHKKCPAYKDRDGQPVTTDGCEVRGAWTQKAFEDQQAKIVSAINSSGAEVAALMEVENSAGISYLPGQSRDKALATLVKTLNAAGGHWAYVPSPPVRPTGEDVIRTAFIYNPGKVQLLGASQILLDPAFANARYPLAQKFKARGTGRPFVAVANHFKSKGSGEDDGTGQGLSNPSREAQARALTSWVTKHFADDAVLLMGDFNAYSQESPARIIKDAGYTDIEKKFDPAGTTYQFSGRLGSLDHVYASAKALKMITGAGVWDINADESVAMQYSRRNYNVTDLYTTRPFAASDHDPALAGLSTR